MNTNQKFKTSRTLLARIQENDPEGWSWFVRLYGPLVYGWARSSGLQPADAADIVQDVLAVVQQKIGIFDGHRKADADFRSWLWGVTRVCLLEHLRLRRALVTSGSSRQTESGIAAFAPQYTEPDIVGGQTVRKLLISTAMRIVKAESESNTWDAFWRMTVQGQTATQIAADLGTNAKAVRQAKFRVTRKLRLLLNEVVPGFDAALCENA